MAELRTVLTDIAFGESPRWHDGRLWFADWGAQEIIAVDPDGQRDVAVRVTFPSFPMCIDWLTPESSDSAEPAEPGLLIVSASDGLLLRREPDGSLTTYADLSALSGYKWNDIVADGRGNVYVNNIGFDFPGGEPGEPGPGTVALVTPDGAARQVADGLAFPNGILVTPDNATLVVAESYASRLTALDIAADGTLSNQRVWADLAGGVPDGICMDAENAIWYADVPNKCCVRVREGGEVLQRVDLDRGCFACMLGGPDRATLYLIAQQWLGTGGMAGGPRTGQVLAVPAPAPGAGWPG
jgi:sugar lactone lactonase YvrE